MPCFPLPEVPSKCGTCWVRAAPGRQWAWRPGWEGPFVHSDFCALPSIFALANCLSPAVIRVLPPSFPSLPPAALCSCSLSSGLLCSPQPQSPAWWEACRLGDCIGTLVTWMRPVSLSALKTTHMCSLPSPQFCAKMPVHLFLASSWFPDL